MPFHELLMEILSWLIDPWLQFYFELFSNQNIKFFLGEGGGGLVFHAILRASLRSSSRELPV